MQKNTVVHIIEVVLGVVIGAMVTFSIVRYRERQHLIHSQYTDWRKLNLILDIVEKNYVDTVNMEGMTDAAVTAALAKLDPHSVYLPPVELEASEQELAGNFDGIGI